MITKAQFEEAKKKNKTLVYNYGFKEYCEIRPLEIHTEKGGNFWFNAELLKSTISNDNSHYYSKGSVHSFSNSFITESLGEMKEEAKKYKATEISFLRVAFA